MKRVEIHDTYEEVKDNTGKVLHPFFIETSVASEHLSVDEAKTKVKEIYEASKKLGTYVERVYKEYLGYVDVDIILDSGKKFKRIIYIIE